MVMIISSCHKDILLYDESNYEPELVIFSTLIPGQPIRALITKSALPEQLDSSIFIDDAIVEVYEDDSYVGKLKFCPEGTDTTLYYDDNGEKHYKYSYKKAYYYSNFIVEDNHIYTLKISALGKTVEKKVEFPEKNTKTEITFSNLVMYDTSHLDEKYIYCYFKCHPNVTINDIPGKNYYVILLGKADVYFNYDTTIDENNNMIVDTIVSPSFFRNISLKSEISDFKDVYCNMPFSDGFDDYITTYVYNDDFFENSSFKPETEDIYYDTQIKKSDNEEIVIYYQTFTISEDLFRYSASENKSEASSDNPFVEQVNVYSNLDGALGVITAANVVQDSVVLSISDFTFVDMPDFSE